MTDDELAAVIDELGREPTELELAMYSVMWSEHCSYKSSRAHLGRLPTEAPWVLVGPGEGAGVIDVGDGLAVAIRIESHNHPSAVEPYQGAATGVGGIIRDIFSMGARPIALMDPLRFGPLDDPRTRYLFEGVVSGISGYGNAVGVPTVGGEVVFDECYAGQPARERAVPRRAARRSGWCSPGPKASATSRCSSARRPGATASGARACSRRPGSSRAPRRSDRRCRWATRSRRRSSSRRASSCSTPAWRSVCRTSAPPACRARPPETAAKTGAGMDVDVARVAKREPGMNPVEVLTSESQERMLAIVRPENLDEVLALCERWEIRAAVVGRVTDTGRFRVYDGYFDAIGVPGANPLPPLGDDPPEISSDRTPVADVPIGSLGDGPLYHRPLAPPADLGARQAADPGPELLKRFPPGPDLSTELLDLLGSPNIADKSWVWRQYDHQLFLNTVAGPGGDASVLRLKETAGRALALSVDGKGRFCALDPRIGSQLAVLEAARNVACTGARPMALVNCLNFGNPEHPEVMWQFSEAVDGMGEACRALGIPVVGGNVSFYNESHGADIDPTPVVGVIGLIDRLVAPPPGIGLRAGDRIVMLGETRPELGGSEWATRHGLRDGRPPAKPTSSGPGLHGLVAGLVTDRMVNGLHDCSDGGVAVCLAEMAIAGGVGFTVRVGDAMMCFSESASRVVLSVAPDRINEVLGRAGSGRVPSVILGDAGGDVLHADGAFHVPLAEAEHAWRDALPSIMDSPLDVG